MEMWHSIGFEDVLKFWPGGLAEGILLRSSIFKNDALKKTISEATNGRKFQRIFTAGTTDANQGRFVKYTYRPGQFFDSHAIDSCLASAAIPAIFPPLKRDGNVLIDGGMIWSYDIPSSIEGCRELGYQDKDMIVDTIILGETHLIDEKVMAGLHTMSIALRAYGLNSFHHHMRLYEQGKEFYPEVNFRYFIAPSETLSLVPMNFKRDHLERIIKVGEQDALRAIELGEHTYGDLLSQHSSNLLDSQVKETPLLRDMLYNPQYQKSTF